MALRLPLLCIVLSLAGLVQTQPSELAQETEAELARA